MKKLFICLIPLALCAAPKGFKSVHGNAKQHTEGTKTTITTKQDAIVHWDQFSIDRGEIVSFIQPSSKSKVLNRITGNKLSEIHGDLKSNGQVYLVNPAGVYIGPHGRIECAAFIASTMDMSNEEFLKGQKIKTQGTISGCIRHEGVIKANTIVKKEGRILLLAKDVHVDGKLRADKVRVLGDEIHLHSKSKIKAPFGEILIGGETKGQDRTIRNANNVTIDKGAVLQADGGGRIICFAKEIMSCDGAISARGIGKEDGGFVEVSGKQGVWLNSHPDMRSGYGKDGTLLIDPGSVSIISGPNVAPPVSMDSFNDGWINDQLTMGSLAIDTTNSTNAATELLTVHTGVVISWATANKLTLTGGTSVHVAGALISSTNAGANFDALEISGNFTGPVGTVNLNGVLMEGDISTVNGNVLLQGRTGSQVVNSGRNGVNMRGGGTIASTGVGADAGEIQLVGISEGVGSSLLLSPFDGGSCGIALYDVGTLISSVDGDVIMSGTSNAASGNQCSGVNFTPNNAVLTTVLNITGDGAFTLDALGGLSAASGQLDGFSFNSGARIITTNGLSTINGTAREGNFICQGWSSIGPVSCICSGTGGLDVTVSSTAPAGTFNQGMRLNTNVVINGGVSDIDIVASGGGVGDSEGFSLDNVCSIVTTSGNIQLMGTGASTGLSNSFGGEIFNNSFIQSTSGQIQIVGIGQGSGAGNRGVAILDTSYVSSTTGNITFTTQGSAAGTQNNQGILLSSTAVAGAINSVDGNILLNCTGGGTTNNNQGLNLNVAGVSIRTTGTGSIIVNGSAGGGTSDNQGIKISNGDIVSNSGSIFLTGVGGTSATTNIDGVIIEGVGAAVTSTSGSITIDGTVSQTAIDDSYGVTVDVPGANVIMTGNAPIHITGHAPGPTVFNGVFIQSDIVNNNANITIEAFSDIVIQGGSTITSAGDILVIADRNVTVQDALTSVVAGGTLTFVADNDFPVAPFFGPGQMNLLTPVLLTSGGELRVYTVQPSQNTLSTLLNGAGFVAGPFGIDSLTETWLTYYPDGSFGGPNFNIYYKVGTTPPDIQPVVVESIAAVSQIKDLNPVIRLQPFFDTNGNIVSNYHGKFGFAWELYRDPRFEPYSSFIFEDNVYWTDR